VKQHDEFAKVKEGDKLKIVGAGAPWFAELGDVVTVDQVRMIASV